MFKNHTKRSHINATEAATEGFGVNVTVTTNPITKGNGPQRNPVTLPPRKCPPADETVPETGEGAAPEGSVPLPPPESTVPSLTDGAWQVCFGSRSREDVRKLQSELQEAAPRTHTILVSVEWDVTRLSESDFSDLVGVFYEEAAARMAQRLRDRGLADAEDVVQNLFLTILRANTRGRRKAMDFLMWAHRCASRFNSALSRQILRRSRELSLLDEHAELFGAEDSHLELSNTAEELHEALSLLTPSHRLVLVLHYLEAKSLKEVAEICGKSANAIKSLLFRTRRKACKELRRVRENSNSPRNPYTTQNGSIPKPTSRRP